MTETATEIQTGITAGGMGLITLARPKALNALSLTMVRALAATLQSWQTDPRVQAVALRGADRAGAPFGAFCSGGDIRFFHQAALAGDAALDDFFTEEYRLDYLVHNYPKPVIAFIDGIVMGGGMGLAQGASLCVATERTQMAMPETRIGFFPDVGGGYFLSRTPGHLGEYIALTSRVLTGQEAVAARLADGMVPAADLPRIWGHLAQTQWAGGPLAQRWVAAQLGAPGIEQIEPAELINHAFGLASVGEIAAALDAANTDWARETARELRARSPLMLHVVLEQIRRARGMGLADELRMARDLAYRCFHLRPGRAGETVEGIRALAIDKDNTPRWNPPAIAQVTADMVAPFFISPWDKATHPLARLR